VPDVVRIEQPDDIAGPATYQLRAVHHHVDHVAAAPVVADQVDRAVDARQLVFQPVPVGGEGGGEAVGKWGAETRG
jgi:hypothetical protein